MPSRTMPYCAVALTATLALASAASATAATTEQQPVVSANWAGYEVDASSEEQRFSQVKGSWVQPSADCSSGQGDSAFWIGLGGGGDNATGLEQVGTEINCDAGGQGKSSAWYELIPAAPVPLDLTISPGDHISAQVDVDGNAVKVSLKDDTTGKSVTKDLSTDNIDVSTAEWIAEAPSACGDQSGCAPVTLADFGSVSFSNASATANGHTGSIADPQWVSAPLALSAVDGSTGGATPGSLSSDGKSFDVSYESADVQTSDPYGDGGGGVYPYDDGSADPYGYGDGYVDPGYGWGYGAY
jgi:Peptidase A4 family